MLFYGFVVAGCVSYRCRLAERKRLVDAADPRFRRSRRKLAAHLNIWVGNLKSIACTAPFLGLAGTCEGILNALSRGVAMEKGAALAMIESEIAATLITTAAGLLVAIPATCFHNYLRARVDQLECRTSFTRPENKVSPVSPFVQTLLPRKQISGLPTYGLMAAPCLAIVVCVFMGFSSQENTPMGLSVDVISPFGPVVGEHFAGKTILIAIRNTSGKGPPILYVNSKRTPWDRLGGTVRTALAASSESTAYVEAEHDVAWADVADAIDVVERVPDRVVLLTNVPDISSDRKRAK